MTEKQDSDGEGLGKGSGNGSEAVTKGDEVTEAASQNVTRPPAEALAAWAERRLAPAQDALARLAASEVANVLVRELDRRRLDAHGNPTDPEGLHYGLSVGIWKLLGLSLEGDDAKIADNVAAVGRGVRVKSTSQDNSVPLRELARDLAADWSGIADPAGMLALTLAKRYRRQVTREAVEVALAKKGRRQRLEWLARACGIETSENAIKSALRN